MIQGVGRQRSREWKESGDGGENKSREGDLEREMTAWGGWEKERETQR